MIIYYIIVLLLNLVLLTAFTEQINLSGAGTIVTMIVIMIFLAYYYNQNREEYNFNNTAYSFDLTEKEQLSITKCTFISYKIYIPLCIPLIFFFSIWVKVAIVIAIYLLAFATGAIIFRIKSGKAVKERIKNENNELEEQIKKESEGKIK